MMLQGEIHNPLQALLQRGYIVFHVTFFILILLIFILLFYFACVIMGVEIRSRGDENECSRAGSAVGLCAMAYGCGGVKQVFQN
jgi:hypothetical protein